MCLFLAQDEPGLSLLSHYPHHKQLVEPVPHRGRSTSSSTVKDLKDLDVKEEPDFIETHCHWIGCDRDFGTQDQLVKVGQLLLVV